MSGAGDSSDDPRWRLTRDARIESHFRVFKIAIWNEWPGSGFPTKYSDSVLKESSQDQSCQPNILNHAPNQVARIRARVRVSVGDG